MKNEKLCPLCGGDGMVGGTDVFRNEMARSFKKSLSDAFHRWYNLKGQKDSCFRLSDFLDAADTFLEEIKNQRK